MTGLALGEFRHLDFHGLAEDCLIEIEVELEAQIRTAKHLGAAAAPGGAEDIAKHVAENVAEGIRGAATAAAGCSLETRMSELIVGGALVRVT